MSITTITGTTTVRRRDPRTGHVITLAAEGIYIRERGKRITYGPISYGYLLLHGARQYVLEQKREKAEARRLKRLGRCR